MNGYINSVQSFGAVDGPGVRYVIFMQGCPLRCSCCHNPDTWEFLKENEVTAEEMLSKILRYRSYFGEEGGLTVSGGEALMQCDFVTELFTLCKKENVHTCLDTSGCILDEKVKKLLSVTDLVLLDVKYTNEDDYKKYVGCSFSDVMKFYDYLEENSIPCRVRQVIIPTKNDSEENIRSLLEITDKRKRSTKKIELLPFRKICQPKYDNLALPFPFGNIPEPSPEKMEELQNIIKNHTD